MSGISQIGLYFHFESWREEVSPGIWLPSYTYFDEKRTAARGNLTTTFHLRGHVWSWGYQNSEIGLATTNERPNSRIELERSGLVASPGQVELALNGIVEQLERANGTNWPPIGCRVLLTTPAEIFSVDHTVYVSRGLLNFVPNKSVLAASRGCANRARGFPGSGNGSLAFEMPNQGLIYLASESNGLPPSKKRSMKECVRC